MAELTLMNTMVEIALAMLSNMHHTRLVVRILFLQLVLMQMLLHWLHLDDKITIGCIDVLR